MPLYLCARLSFQGQSDLNISYSMPPLIDPMMLPTLVSKTDKDLTIGTALLYSIKKALMFYYCLSHTTHYCFS